jgi:nucleoside-diphosphate-sugar epimerase
MLVEAGHDVAGMTRSPAKAAQLEEAGARAYIADAFDADAVAAAVADFAPDVIVHQLTDLPRSAAGLAFKVAANNRIRKVGTDNLLAAAKASGGARVVAQSIGFPVPTIARSGPAHLEKAVLAADGVVLRYGQFYGPGTWSDAPPKRGPAVHVETAARRTVDHLDAESGVYLIVDD